MKSRFRWLLVLLVLSLLAGSLWALRDREVNPAVPLPAEKPLPGYPPLPEETSRGSLPERGGPPKTEEGLMPDLSGLARGSGNPDPLLPEAPGPSSSASEEEWQITIPPYLRDIADQLEELKQDLEEGTLKAAKSGLEVIPGVTASPDRARWSLSGGQTRVEISIPAEDLKIDLGEILP